MLMKEHAQREPKPSPILQVGSKACKSHGSGGLQLQSARESPQSLCQAVSGWCGCKAADGPLLAGIITGLGVEHRKACLETSQNKA